MRNMDEVSISKVLILRVIDKGLNSGQKPLNLLVTGRNLATFNIIQFDIELMLLFKDLAPKQMSCVSYFRFIDKNRRRSRHHCY